MKNRKRIKIRSQTHYALFRNDLPFKPKVERNKKRYKRHDKHKKSKTNE